MLKFLSFILISSILLSSEINIKLEDTSANYDEINSMKFKYKKNAYSIDDKASKRIIEENRLLALREIKDRGLNKQFLTEIKLDIEQKLAAKLIEETQKDRGVSEDVLLSYYKDNKKEFYIGEAFVMQTYKFLSFDAALQFYNKNFSNKELAQEYSKENNISVSTTQSAIKFIPKDILVLLKNDKEINYFTTPQKFKNGYLVFYIEKYIEDEKYIPFEKVKNKIKANLLNKTYVQIRKKLIGETRKIYEK